MTVDYRNYANIRSTMSYRLFLCGLVTLVVMYCHRLLPVKVMDVVPGKSSPTYLFGDTNAAGVSVASWTDDSHLAWQCNIENDAKGHSCGFTLALDSNNPKGVDLSGYDSVQIDLEYEGSDKRLRFFTRTYAEGFSDIKNPETARYQNASIPTQFLRGPVTIGFAEFFVAEWWVGTLQVPREFTFPDFHNTQSFGIDLSSQGAPGLHKFRLKKLQFVGRWISAERWYLGILVFWMVAIFVAGAYNLWQLKRQNRAERQRLEALINQNSALENETNHYKQLSMLDQLTGVLNRHGLSEFIQKSYPENAMHQVALIIIDVDFFKKINDNYGHDCGDRVLHGTAQVIRQHIRNKDVVARWGGEEFVVVLPETQVSEAQIVAEKLRSLVAQHSYDSMPDLKVTISLGVGGIDGYEPFHQLFRRVDVALYQAKAQGRNRVVVA